MKEAPVVTARFKKSRNALIFAVFAGILVVGCSDDALVSPDNPQESELNLFDLAPDVQIQELAPATLVLERNTARLMDRQGVVATAVGLTDAGRPAINVYTDGPLLDDVVEIDGIPVIVIETGPIVTLQEAQERRQDPTPQPKCDTPPCGGGGGNNGGGDDGGGSFDPTARNRPAPNGSSVGHPSITAGTLGAVVTKGGRTFILSNNHVLANSNNANPGNLALQPGPFDGGTSADRIGTLSQFVSINFSGGNNTMDAAIAEVDDPADVTGTAPGYGAPRTQPINASVGMRVMKQGRTTGFTKGRVQGINATVNVNYGSAGVARFVGQIVIGGGGFSSGGDSGSLIVVQNGRDARRPVGLLFAGGGGTTIANPIGPVLSTLGVSIVGDN